MRVQKSVNGNWLPSVRASSTTSRKQSCVKGSVFLARTRCRFQTWSALSKSMDAKSSACSRARLRKCRVAAASASRAALLAGDDIAEVAADDEDADEAARLQPADDLLDDFEERRPVVIFPIEGIPPTILHSIAKVRGPDEVLEGADSTVLEFEFFFLKASKLRELRDPKRREQLRQLSDTAGLPSYQKLLPDGQWLVKRKLSLFDAWTGSCCEQYLAVSHQWIRWDDPDERGVQLDALLDHLDANPQIQYVWFECVQPSTHQALEPSMPAHSHPGASPS